MLAVRGSYTFLTSASSTQLLKRLEYPANFTSTSVRLFRLCLRMIFSTSQSVSSDLSTACNSAWLKNTFYFALQQIDQFVHRDALHLETSLYFKYLIGPLFVVCTYKRSSLMRYPNQLSNYESK